MWGGGGGGGVRAWWTPLAHGLLDKCFHLPGACRGGSTFPYWLKWKSASGYGLIMDSRDNARGYANSLSS